MVTIDDVARRARVSPSTVSYALSGKRPISAETRRRVERAIDALGYRPHAGAKALASSRTDIIGLMAPLRVGVDVNVIMQFVAGVVAGANASGYDVLMVTQEGGGLDRVAGSSMVDALVVMDIESDDPRIPQLAALRQPTVLIGLPAHPQGLSCIDLDFAQAGSLAARGLIDAGHRCVALLGPPIEVMNRHTSYAERMTRGFVSACEDTDTTYVIVPTDPSVAGAHDAVDRLLALLPEVTGVVVHNEVALPHIMTALAKRGRRCPEEISLIAVCPENTALTQTRPVTSIDIPTETIGRSAVDMLTSLLNEDAPAQVRLLSPTLVERGSVRRLTETPATDPAPETP